MSTHDANCLATTRIPADYARWIRRRVGSRKIFLVFGSVVLRDGAGRILLQRRTDFDFWGIPGGAQELGEDIVTCASRELREESGLEAGTLTLSGVCTDPVFDVRYPNGDLVQQFGVCFRAQLAGGAMRVAGVAGTDRALAREETAAIARVRPDALPATPGPPGWTRFFELAAAHLEVGYFLY